MTRAISLMLPLLAVLGAAAGASAQADPAERFRRAVARYEASNYEAALRDFQALYEETEAPALLYNIARCQEQLGDLGAAATSLARYLRRVPDASDRAEAEALLRDIERRQTEAEATVDPPPEPQATRPDPETTADPAPPDPVSQPVETPPADAGGPSGLAITAATLLAVGGAGVVVGAILGGLTAARHGTLSGGCGDTSTGCSEDEIGGLQGLGLGADVALFGGGAIAVVGLVLLVVGLSEGESPQALLRREVRF